MEGECKIINKFIEKIKDVDTKRDYDSCIFDFDGTLSLIRQGWQEVMYSYFTEVLLNTPGSEDKNIIRGVVEDFVDRLTGKQTIYQVLQLVEEIKKRGGTAEDPLYYKREYLHRLWQKIEGRVRGLKSGQLNPERLLVPGSRDFLDYLKKQNINLYLASGTDEEYVLDEADALGLTDYFGDDIYGALDDYKNYSKAMVIERILEENSIEGKHMLGFGDGYVEIQNVKEVKGLAVGVATNEGTKCGINEWKRERLINAGADIIIPHFGELGQLKKLLFGEETGCV